MASSKLSRFDLPGFNLPLNFVPYETYKKHVYDADSRKTNSVRMPAAGEGKALLPSALDAGDRDSQLPITTLREFTMIQLMNHITDKPGWETKVFDDNIVTKWRAEVLASEGRDVSSAMLDCIMQELRYKAKIFDETKAVNLYNGDVVKSDSKVPDSLREALKSAVAPLEAVPEPYKDYHPGSEGKVVDLVHPSLFPLIYGRSRILPDKLVGLHDCLEMIGLGNCLPIPSEDERKHERHGYHSYTNVPPYSRNYQWLPCEVEFSVTDESMKITSYINNLHPQRHQDLYAVIENIISHAIPLWNMTLTPSRDSSFKWKRIKFSGPSYDPDPESLPENMKPQRGSNEGEDDYWQRKWEWEMEFRRTHIIQPEPADFTLPEKTIATHADEAVDLRRDYGHRGLQVIVKLATIYLTPEKATYDGGSWHVEGQMNEHICATALYYYDSVNITESRLAFRQQSCDEDATDFEYNQNDQVWSKPILGLENEDSCVQDVGDIVCKEGRLVTFPNTLQHRVQPFELEDHSKPGHRKLLALFLIDPNVRVISTANVPPQQRHWWSEVLKSSGCFKQLAAELQEKVIEDVDDFPIGIDEAKELRLKLMDERKEFVVLQNEGFQTAIFSLCEH